MLRNLFLIFILIFLIIVEGSEIVRNERALPPRYLNVPGFKDCLGSKKTNLGHEAWCFPESKPQKCDDNSWKELQELEDNDELRQCSIT
ncbi:hypothetical protein ACQ4LE_009885 [Meloidogyne hapla]